MNFGEIASALGAGATTAGDFMMQQHKEELAQKLEIDKEKRARDNEEYLLKLRNTMDLQKPASSQILMNADGTGTKKIYDGMGNELKSIAAGPQEISDLNYQTQTRANTLAHASLEDQLTQADINLKKVQTDAYPEEHSLDSKLKQAQIDNYSSLSDNRGVAKTKDYTAGDIANYAYKDNSIKAYIAKAKDAGMDDETINQFINQAAAESLKNKINPRDNIIKILQMAINGQ